jgi:hypothetical protein
MVRGFEYGLILRRSVPALSGPITDRAQRWPLVFRRACESIAMIAPAGRTITVIGHG